MTIKSELLALQRAAPGRVLKAEKVVAWAKAHHGSALYRSLEWNNLKAANEYRVWQVRRLIQVHVIDAGGAPVMVSLSVDRGAGGGYRAVSDVLSNRDLSEIMLQDALQDLERIKVRYHRVEALTSVWSAVDKVKRKTPRSRPARAGAGADAHP